MTTFQASRLFTINDTIGLTTLSQHATILLANKEKHGIGDSETDHLCTGMDTARKDKTERHALLVRRQMEWRTAKNHVALHRYDIQTAYNERAGDTSQVEQAIEKAGTRPAYNSRRLPSLDPLIGSP